VIAVVGYVGILAALIAAAWLMVQGGRVARSPEPNAASLRAPVMVLLGGALVAFVALELAILTHDFSIEYVARNTSTATPFVFLLASGWAALEGSIVLWGIVLAVFTWLVARTVTGRDVLGAGALAVMGAVAVFWFGLMATAANPFAICTEVVDGVCAASSWLPVGAAVAPTDGLGPNPLLQNHILMAVHPPVLYLGYVGFTVPFAFAVSALATGRQGRAWLDRTHRWSLIAWTFLTAGIFLGGWWSYEVLGWGGYWAWDPVENAALLPWLVGTAFIHSAVVQRRRGMLQAWNFVLVIATFALTILGTFLTRSGVIASVHSFTQSPVGPALLGFLAVTTIGALALFAARAESVASSKRLESLSSREGFFLLNNLLLTLFALTVLVGTVYPLVVEAFNGREVSVGRPFFDRASVPIAFALLLAIGVGAVAPWRVATPQVLWSRTRLGVMIGLLAGAGAVLTGVRSLAVVVAVVLAGFLIGTIAGFFARQVNRRRGGDGSWGRAVVAEVAADPGYWGGQISHIGLALAAIAIATTSVLAVRAEVRLAVGETAMVGGYCVEYLGPFQRSEPSRFVQGANVAILDEACRDTLAALQPRIHRYPNAAQAVATPAVRTGLIDDVYVSLAGGSDDEIVLDVFVFPLQWLLWLGGLIVVAGGVVALGRKARRQGVRTDPQETDAEIAHV
jgi:cytochrome c-type biogenesis protein CcmF